MASGSSPTLVTLRAGWSAARRFSLPSGARCSRRTRDLRRRARRNRDRSTRSLRQAGQQRIGEEFSDWKTCSCLSLSAADHLFHFRKHRHGFRAAQAAHHDGRRRISVVQAFGHRKPAQHGIQESGGEAVARADGGDTRLPNTAAGRPNRRRSAPAFPARPVWIPAWARPRRATSRWLGPDRPRRPPVSIPADCRSEHPRTAAPAARPAPLLPAFSTTWSGSRRPAPRGSPPAWRAPMPDRSTRARASAHSEVPLVTNIRPDAA